MDTTVADRHKVCGRVVAGGRGQLVSPGLAFFARKARERARVRMVREIDATNAVLAKHGIAPLVLRD